jgi:diguanylate cyclase (GGDEF)-like protein
VREKRALRIDDASAGASALPFEPHRIDRAVRSVIAVPLLVGERVVGVLSVQSRRQHAYDDHQLSVLATIAQQVAVAVENAHHYTQATIDSLTGLHLRDYFFRRFEEEYTRAKRYAGAFSILMLDLDGFKEINDRQGHLAGDRYLRALGVAIKERMRGADLACRYGGDEFCILLPETDLSGARPIAERLRQALAHLMVDVDGGVLRTTVSIGIASYPEHDTGDIKGLLLRADQALYKAKSAGRDRVVPFAA